jgi:hypothetical protein
MNITGANYSILHKDRKLASISGLNPIFVVKTGLKRWKF